MERMQAELYIFFKVKAEKLEKFANNWNFSIIFCYKLNMRYTL